MCSLIGAPIRRPPAPGASVGPPSAQSLRHPPLIPAGPGDGQKERALFKGLHVVRQSLIPSDIGEPPGPCERSHNQRFSLARVRAGFAVSIRARVAWPFLEDDGGDRKSLPTANTGFSFSRRIRPQSASAERRARPSGSAWGGVLPLWVGPVAYPALPLLRTSARHPRPPISKSPVRSPGTLVLSSSCLIMG